MTLSTMIKGVQLPEPLLVAALDALPSGFSKSEFAQALSDAGLPEANDSDLVRRAMQYLKRQGLISFADDTGTWSLTSLGVMRLPTSTLPLSPLANSSPALPATAPSDRLGDAAETVRLLVSVLACLALIGALVGLNASFAWELGREAQHFQILITLGLMALDLMRPGFVMMSFFLFDQGRRGAGVLALLIALMLSPVSVLSTTSILSAAVLLGAEMNEDAQVAEETRQTLRAEHARLLEQAASDEAAWLRECARGGCGPIAADLETELEATLDSAQGVLDRILALSDDTQGQSELLSRLVLTFEGLGLFGMGRQLLLPLFLALSLELGALFGPVILLRRRRI